MTTAQKTVYLLDGHSLVYRAHHAMSVKGSLTNSTGFPTGAIFGFLQILFRLLEKENPQYIAVVFDPKGPTFRQEIYAEYKAHRPPQPEEIRLQFPLLQEIVTELNIPIFCQDGFEADDLLGSLAKWADDQGHKACIVTIDKDLFQCVNKNISILRDHLQKVEFVDEALVMEKMGVRPDQVVDYLGLLGDASDNIPGVPGIGKKRAADLLAEYQTVERILEEAKGKTTPKFWANLDEFREQALLSVNLARIRTDVPPATDWKELSWSMPTPSARYREILQELEFRSMLDALGGETLAERTTAYETIFTEQHLQDCLAKVRQTGAFSLDTETTGLDCFQADLVGISFSWSANKAAYIPLSHPEHKCLPLAVVRKAFNELLGEKNITCIAHNWNFDYKILACQQFNVGPIAFDTMIAAYLLNPDRKGIGLKALALETLGIQMTEIRELVPAGNDFLEMASVDVQQISDYACQDADCTFQLYERFQKLLEENELLGVFHDIEMPLVTVLAEMEMRGVALDLPYFKQLLQETQARLTTLRESIYEIAGRQFNINSTKQLATLLFEELKLPIIKKTATGASTDVEVLEALKEMHPLPAQVHDYRLLEKLRGTYIESLPSLINPITGLIHTSYNQTIAATGRLSSSDPNLQNIPNRTEDGRQIRAGFLPSQRGWRLMAADYSQIELRILAHVSKDPALVHAYQNKIDIHALTASKVFQIPLQAVSKDQRNSAKAINFGLLYGMSAFRLSNELKISRQQAKEFMEQYFASYKGVQNYIDETLEFCRSNGFVKTLLGRRRLVPDIKSSNFNARGQAERIAVNTPIQGSSADMIKVAMIHIARRLKEEGFESKMILQVHDELIFEFPESEKKALEALVVAEMQGALPLLVPIEVDVEFGERWSDV